MKNNIICKTFCFNRISADFIKIICEIDKEIFCFLCVYRFHNNNINQFLIDLTEIPSDIKQKNCILLGDINIDILDSSNGTDEYLFFMASRGFTSLINEPTRITSSSAKCINHFFFRTHINFVDSVVSSIWDACITDHVMLKLSFIALSNLEQPSNKSINFKRINFNHFIELLNAESWDLVYSESNVSEAFGSFLNILSNYLHLCTQSTRQICRNAKK